MSTPLLLKPVLHERIWGGTSLKNKCTMKLLQIHNPGETPKEAFLATVKQL
jgi:mannose-6-phosphate isomerase class I